MPVRDAGSTLAKPRIDSDFKRETCSAPHRYTSVQAPEQRAYTECIPTVGDEIGARSLVHDRHTLPTLDSYLLMTYLKPAVYLS